MQNVIPPRNTCNDILALSYTSAFSSRFGALCHCAQWFFLYTFRSWGLQKVAEGYIFVCSRPKGAGHRAAALQSAGKLEHRYRLPQLGHDLANIPESIILLSGFMRGCSQTV